MTIPIDVLEASFEAFLAREMPGWVRGRIEKFANLKLQRDLMFSCFVAGASFYLGVNEEVSREIKMHFAAQERAIEGRVRKQR